MAANCSQPGSVIAPASALHALLTTHPELTPEASGLAWTLTPTGVLHAELRDAVDGGLAVDRCASALGATVLRESACQGADRAVIACVVAVFQGVPVEVWETYRDPETLPLGAVAVLAGGDR